MDYKKHTTPDSLEKYSFLWSEARLILAAIALFLGGFPLVFKIVPYGLSSTTSSLLTICWIISGIASAYLGWKWYTGGQTIFGKKEMKDKIAFLISVVSGINLGLAGILGSNIGMNISSSKTVFIVVGIIYLISAGYLYKRWNESNKKLFDAPTIVVQNESAESDQES